MLYMNNFFHDDFFNYFNFLFLNYNNDFFFMKSFKGKNFLMDYFMNMHILFYFDYLFIFNRFFDCLNSNSFTSGPSQKSIFKHIKALFIFILIFNLFLYSFLYLLQFFFILCFTKGHSLSSCSRLILIIMTILKSIIL